MLTSVSYKSNQFLWLVLKLFIVIGCGYFISIKLTEKSELKFHDFISKINENNVFLVKNIILLLILTFFNWFFEILKWQKLASQVVKISFSTATKQSLAALTTSLITPNKIGEYGTKVLFFERSKRKRILALNFISNFYQLVITLLAGFIGLIFLYDHFAKVVQLEHIVSVISLFIIGYFIFLFSIKKIPFFKTIYVKLSLFLSELTATVHRFILGLSLIRYLIFSHQFYFLLLLFNIDIGYNYAMASIFSVYFIASIIPILSLFDFVLKGSVAIFVFSFFHIDPVTILTITTLMWILNFVVPAIFGSYFVLTFKHPKT